jgi:hypothetical protein
MVREAVLRRGDFYLVQIGRAMQCVFGNTWTAQALFDQFGRKAPFHRLVQLGPFALRLRV